MYQVGKIAWRLQLGSAFIPAIPLLFGIYFCPGNKSGGRAESMAYAEQNRLAGTSRNTDTTMLSDLSIVSGILLFRLLATYTIYTRRSDLRRSC